MSSKLDMYILPIKAKEVLTRLEYRRLAPEELSFWFLCGCFALLHDNRLSLSMLKEYGLPGFKDSSKYDELWMKVKHLFEGPNKEGFYTFSEVTWALNKTRSRQVASKKGNKARWPKKITLAQQKADEIEDLKDLLGVTKEDC